MENWRNIDMNAFWSLTHPQQLQLTSGHLEKLSGKWREWTRTNADNAQNMGTESKKYVFVVYVHFSNYKPDLRHLSTHIHVSSA